MSRTFALAVLCVLVTASATEAGIFLDDGPMGRSSRLGRLGGWSDCERCQRFGCFQSSTFCGGAGYRTTCGEGVFCGCEDRGCPCCEELVCDVCGETVYPVKNCKCLTDAGGSTGGGAAGVIPPVGFGSGGSGVGSVFGGGFGGGGSLPGTTFIDGGSRIVGGLNTGFGGGGPLSGTTFISGGGGTVRGLSGAVRGGFGGGGLSLGTTTIDGGGSLVGGFGGPVTAGSGEAGPFLGTTIVGGGGGGGAVDGGCSSLGIGAPTSTPDSKIGQVPEPTSLAIYALGGMTLVLLGRRRSGNRVRNCS